MDRYSFGVERFHLLLHAGLSRRFLTIPPPVIGIQDGVQQLAANLTAARQRVVEILETVDPEVRVGVDPTEAEVAEFVALRDKGWHLRDIEGRTQWKMSTIQRALGLCTCLVMKCRHPVRDAGRSTWVHGARCVNQHTGAHSGPASFAIVVDRPARPGP